MMKKIKKPTTVWSTQPQHARLRVWLESAFSTARYADNDRLLITRSGGPLGESPIIVRDAGTGKELKQIEAPQGVSEEIAISPDGRTVAVIEAERVVCRKLPTLREIRSIPLDDCNHVLFDPRDSKSLLTASFEGKIQRWRTKSATTLFEVGDFYAGSFDVTRDGRHLLVAAGKRIALMDIKKRKEIFQQKLSRHGDVQAAVAPDGSCIAVGQNMLLRTLSMDGATLRKFAWKKRNMSTNWVPTVGVMAFTPDSKRLATASGEGWVYVWDVASGGLVQLMPVNNEPLKDIAYAKDGQELVVCTAEFEGEYDSHGHAELWPSPDFDGLSTAS
jgi:WD40 repeat protein